LDLKRRLFSFMTDSPSTWLGQIPALVLGAAIGTTRSAGSAPRLTQLCALRPRHARGCGTAGVKSSRRLRIS
jgi:hypothetical protein